MPVSPTERTNAVLAARLMLAAIVVDEELSECIRESAHVIFRTFPTVDELRATADACPVLWAQPETVALTQERGKPCP